MFLIWELPKLQAEFYKLRKSNMERNESLIEEGGRLDLSVEDVRARMNG